MNTLTQILPQFSKIKLLQSEDVDLEFQPSCAYLLSENISIAKFIEKIGKKSEKSNEILNLYDFYTAYNIKFPTAPATVSLMNQKRLVAIGINSLEELLKKIFENSSDNLPLAVFLSIEARTMEEMLKIKRDILQQFIFLRMYIPIIISENFRAAVKNFDEILNATHDEKTDITFIGTKKSGKSSLINAVLGAEYTPSSSELPTPNKVSYSWSGFGDNSLRVECEGRKKIFHTADEVNGYLANEFRQANKNSSALKPMKIYIPNFPEDLRDFTITDTPGPNFAVSKEHTAVTENTLTDIKHCVFIMNYSAHLTDDEIALFDKVYRVLNNKRRHQTIIVAVNRIDEMYAADVIKSYERFADYILRRLNALGYENIVVVSISAITSVYIEKIRQLISDADKNSLDRQLKNLRREYKGTDKATAVSFVEKSLETLSDFHGVEIENLNQLKKTSRVDYLIKVAESMYNPFEQFEWIDETFEDVLETDFENDEEFFERVLSFAEEGDIDAMDFVGRLYEIGRGVEENETKAFEWFTKAANLGNAQSMKNLACCYRYGIGTQENLPKAAEWFQKSAEAGEIESMVSLGAMYFRGEGVGKNELTAFNWNMKAAELGHLTAMSNVAYQYRNGIVVEKNPAKAVEWYQKSADGGNYSAMCELADMYRTGEGIQKNLQEALKWYRKSAEAGYDEAMVSLGLMYFNGEGVSKNEITAFNWNMKAAELGNLTAMYNVAYQYREGIGTQKNPAKAVEWYTKAADDDYYPAMCELAEMYQNGEGVQKDEGRAFELYKKAAEADFEVAFEPLAEIYYDRKNYERAFEYFSKAADNDYIIAMFYLGSMYESGKGIEQDYAKSFEWYKKAADEGDFYAMGKIAYDYAEGLGVWQNFGEAVFWYEKAIDGGNKYAIAELGELYYENEYFTKALKYYKLAAENGNAEYMNRVGVMYASGKGVTPDDYEAVKWYRKAANSGNAWGMFNLACCYKDGRGSVPKSFGDAVSLFKRAADKGIEDAFSELGYLYYDAEKYYDAFEWFMKAAKIGDVGCMNDVGNMYYRGQGVSKDYFESTTWYRKAAEKGFAWAMYNLAGNYRDGKGVHKNLDTAVKWFKQAAENGIDDALEALGSLYYNTENFGQSFYWYKKAAEKGNADCMNYLGVMYANGKGITENKNEAVRWYRKAMDAGSTWGIHNLGYCYYYGKGVEENNAKAFEYFSKAAQEGNSSSMIFLGHMYKKGYYVSRDYGQAVYWYRKAREAGNEDAKEYIDEIYSERNNNSSGGCFITTAVCDSFGKADDCYELTAFRNFRDNWLVNQSDGENLIAEYYEVAPKIVEKINSLSNSAEIYKNIWRDYLSNCLKFIEVGENSKCKKIYVDMVNTLKEKFLTE